MSFYATKGNASRASKRKASRKKNVVDSDSSWSSASSEESEDSYYESDISEPAAKKPKQLTSSNSNQVVAKQIAASTSTSTSNSKSTSKSKSKSESSDCKSCFMEDGSGSDLPEELTKIVAKLRKKYKPGKSWILVNVPICRSFGFYHNKFYRYDRKVFLQGILKGVIPNVQRKFGENHGELSQEDGEKVSALLNKCGAQVMKILQVLPLPPRQRRLKHYLPPYQAIPILMEEALEASKISSEQEALLNEKIEACKLNRAETHAHLARLRERIKDLESQAAAISSKGKADLFRDLPQNKGSMPHYVLPKRVQAAAQKSQTPASAVQVKDFHAAEFLALKLLKKYLE